MAEIASAYVSLIPSMKGAKGKISSELGGELDAAGKKGGKRLGSGLTSSFLPATKAMAGAAAGIFAAAKIGGFLKDSIAEARESQKVGALTAQVIKTTGGAAKVTAKQVGDLATAISNKTGIDDEAIQSASNLLLTFTNVRNEVGKGNDVFNQATQIATDMGAALGTEPKAAAIQLGKALNDPIKGVTALQRVGVSFTKQQKDQIKTLVGSGKSLDAQKIILKELNKEFGGAAAASATGGEKLAVAFGNFKEQIGTALLPVIDKVAGFLTTKIIPALSSFITGMQDGTGAGGAFIGFFKNIWAVIQPFTQTLMSVVVPAVRNLFASFTAGGGPSAIQGLFTTLVTFLRGQVFPAFMGIVTAVRTLIAVALPIVQAFVAGMMARIQPMLPTIRAIFGQIGSIVVQYMGLVQAVIQRVTAVISFIWSRWGSNIMSFVAKAFSNVLTIIGGALRIIQGIIKTVTSIIRGDWSGAWDGIKMIVSGAWQVIKGVVSQALHALSGIIRGGGALLKAAMTSVGDKINSALDNMAGRLYSAGQDMIRGLINGIKDMASNVARAAADVVGNAVQAAKDKLKIHSPSRVFVEIGRYTGEGMVVGMNQMRSQVSAASRGMAGAAITGATGSGSLVTAGGAHSGVAGAAVVINGNVGWQPDEVARKIASRQRDAAALYNLQGVTA